MSAMRDEAPWTRAERAELAGLCLFALALRVAYVLALRASPYFDAPVLDPAFHVDWARTLLRGERFAEGPFFRAPLYVWWLAGMLGLSGGDLLLPRLAQCLLGTATTAAAYLVARRAFGRREARLAGLATATYWVLIYFDGELLIETLAIPLDLVALWCTLGLARGAGRGRSALAGGVWGIAALARPNVVLLLPFYALWVLGAARRRGDRRPAASALAFLAGAALPILPVTATNAWAGGELVLISTQAGVNLWIGNNPQADGSTAWVPGTSGDDFWATYRGAEELAEREAGRDLRPGEVSRHYSRKARAFVLEHPGRALALLARKLALFWRDEEIGNNQPIRFTAFHFAPFLRWTPLRFAWLAPLGLIGCCLALRRGPFPLWSFVPLYGAGVIAFFVCSRFRAPVLPVLAILGAHALVAGWDAWRAGRLAALSAGVVAFLAGVALLVATRPDPARAEGAGELHLALGHERAGDPAAAATHFERALALEPTPIARVQFAAHLEQRGDLARARELLASAARDAPANSRVLDSWLGFLLRRGPPEDLRAACDAALVHAPDLATVQYHQGAALLNEGKPKRAEAALREARRLEPSGSRPQAVLGVLLAGRGEHREALELYGEALTHGRFENARAQEEATWRNAVRSALALGEPERARELAASCARRHPGSNLANELEALVR